MRLHLIALFEFAVVFALPTTLVKLELYGEAGSPEFEELVNGPLKEVLSADGMFSGSPPALIYDFIPFGDAYYNTTQCGGKTYAKDNMFCWVEQCGGKSPPAECFAGKPVCQHGPAECLANLYEACAKYVYPDPTMYGPFVTCLEGDKKADAEWWGPCARHWGLDDAKISACAANDTLANQVTMENAKKTLLLGSTKPGTPWVLLNGEAVPEGQLDGLLEMVCERINPNPSKRPKGCQPGAIEAVKRARTE